MKKFPKQIYVKYEQGGTTEEEWLAAQVTPDGIVEADDKVKVGIYKLVKVVTATAKTELLD